MVLTTGFILFQIRQFEVLHEVWVCYPCQLWYGGLLSPCVCVDDVCSLNLVFADYTQ